MKRPCACPLSDCMHRCLAESGKEAMSLDFRSIEDLAVPLCDQSVSGHGEPLCCVFMFIAYLAFLCDDADGLACDLRKVILNASKAAAGQ